MNGLQKKYGLFTAIAMIVGIVVGSGIFFKTEGILELTGGNMPIGLIAFIVGGMIMIISANAFAIMANKYEKVNGLIDYAEATCGKNYAYILGWYSAVMYYPAMTSVLAWVSARYFCELLGIENAATSTECLLFSGVFLIVAFVLNILSPKIAGKFQISTTIIKMIPLVLMAVIGTVVGIMNGNTAEGFKTIEIVGEKPIFSAFFGALVSCAFAYEGWIVTTSINSEIKNAKKNLPIALTIGSLIVVVLYVLYYIGVTGGATIKELSEGGSIIAFTNIFGGSIGKILTGFIVISCLGTLNGLMVGCCRSFYGLAANNRGPKPEAMKEISPATNMPYNSAIVSLLLCALWLVYFYGANLVPDPWFGENFSFDSSEVPIITIYVFYIPMLINLMKKHPELSFGKRFILIPAAILCSVFMLYAMIDKLRMTFLYFLIILAVCIAVGLLFHKSKDSSNKKK